ncbi:MAG: TIGR01620 family protein [Rhizobiales bacterium]|nr:TIGR01620 family protein [Hyphomicrobiales bacterium]
MSERQSRKPAAFDLHEPDVVMTTEPDSAAVPVPVEMPIPVRRRRWRWGAVFWSAAGGLVLLGLGLAVTSLVEGLFARVPWLGSFALVLAVLAVLALLAIFTREVLGLARLATVETLRRRADAVLTSDDRAEGASLVRDLMTLTQRTPQLARSRARLQGHLGDIIDGADLVRLAERELMAPLDDEARRLVAASARRVSVVTAVSPRAVVDMLFVFINAVGLVRRLAVLYGGRPGTLGLIRLVRHVVSHLALTGGIAATDSLIQQVIGHGLAAKLSARLGEGMLNGLLTARLGLAAIEVTRPLPFSALRRPALNDLVSSMLRVAEKQNEANVSERPPVP